MVDSTHSDSAIDLCSRGLILIGAEPITSFADGTTEALVAVNMYEDIVRSALVNTRWRFATNQTQLNLLTDAPTGRYDNAYQLPTDRLMIHALTVNDNVIAYQLYGDMAYADTADTDTVVCDYTYRPSEENFPPHFNIAVIYSLANVFAVSIARDASLGQQMAVMANNAMLKARNVDSQQQTTRSLTQTRFITERRS